MRVFQINAVPYGSTGRIMVQISQLLEQQAHEALCTTGFTWKGCDRPDYVMTSGIVEKTVHTWLARITGKTGGFSTLATWRLLRRMDKMKPDLIHLHNLHGWFINLPMLFGYIKKHNIPVVWTLSPFCYGRLRPVEDRLRRLRQEPSVPPDLFRLLENQLAQKKEVVYRS